MAINNKINLSLTYMVVAATRAGHGHHGVKGDNHSIYGLSPIDPPCMYVPSHSVQERFWNE